MDSSVPRNLRPSRALTRVVCYTGLLLLGIGGCGEATPEFSDGEILAVFQELHTAIYDVYGVDFDRDAVYDLLAGSFAGEALTHEYVEHYTTKWRMLHDDTKVTILRVDYADAHVSQRIGEGAVVEADWNVGGVVYHQGHSHARINRYQAAYTLQPRAQGFRIVDTKMKDMERVRLDMMSGGNLGIDEPLPTSGQGMLSPSDLLKAGMVPAEPGPDGEETP